MIAYACYAIGNSYARKACATLERIIAYACYAIGDNDRLNVTTTKSTVSNYFSIVMNRVRSETIIS